MSSGRGRRGSSENVIRGRRVVSIDCRQLTSLRPGSRPHRGVPVRPDQKSKLKRHIWAGVKLPGGQYRKREQLAEAHAILRRIAAGEVSSRQLPDNAALLARRENDAAPATATVFHLPVCQIRPSSAA